MPGLKQGRRQAGIALLESLVALAILSGALLGMLLVQLRTLEATAGANHRAQALRLIDDLAERIRANPDGFARLADYRVGWGAPPAPDADCEAQWCDPAALARWDLARWKASVAHALPLGDAAVFDVPALSNGTPRRALDVLIGWRSKEADTFAPAPDAEIWCPAGLACHFGHVQP